jgi:plasmid stabilization system protein ParE
MKPELQLEAEADLLHHAEYLRASANEDAVRAFAEEVRKALAKIQANPRTWSLASGSKRVRKVQINRFRMQIFYFIRSDGVPFVIEIAGPGLQPRWRRRL